MRYFWDMVYTYLSRFLQSKGLGNLRYEEYPNESQISSGGRSYRRQHHPTHDPAKHVYRGRIHTEEPLGRASGNSPIRNPLAVRGGVSQQPVAPTHAPSTVRSAVHLDCFDVHIHSVAPALITTFINEQLKVMSFVVSH